MKVFGGGESDQSNHVASLPEEVAEAIEWENTFMQTSDPRRNIACIDNDLIDNFFRIICDNPRDMAVPDLMDLSPFDLLTLTGNSWLSNFIILALIDLVNDSSDDTRVIFLDSVCGLKQSLRRVKRELRGKLDPKIIMCLIVKNEDGNISTSSKGCHFTCGVYFPKRQKLVYCDTFGWPVPKDFYELFLSCEKNCSLYFVHHPDITSYDKVSCKYSHDCVDGVCSKLYMRQASSNMCGVVVVVTFVLVAFRCDIFDIICEFEPSVNPSIQHIAYLKNISPNSAFLRHVLIIWVMTKNIDVTMLFDPIRESSWKMRKDSGAVMNIRKTRAKVIKRKGTEDELNGSLSDCSLEDTSAKASMKSRSRLKLNIPRHVMAFLKKRPKANFKKNRGHIEIVMYVKGYEKAVRKYFPCSKSGKNDASAIGSIEKFFEKDFSSFLESKSIVVVKQPDELALESYCTEELRTLLLKEPTVQFYSKGPCLRLPLIGAKSKKKFIRHFKCTQEGVKDSSAMDKVREFLSSYEAVIWLRRKEESCFDWIPDGELMVGNNTKLYFDNYQFDINKEVNVAKGYKSVYNSDSTLAVSVVENDSWGKTHRFDENYVIDDDAKVDGSALDNDSKPAVTMYIWCASKSQQCRTDCGYLINSLVWDDVNVCPGCSSDLSDKVKQCSHCLIVSSPSGWYKLDEKTLCSACYQYQKKHGRLRPAELLTSYRKVKSSYHPHVQCGWRMKFVIYPSNMSVWNLYRSNKNEFYHRSPAEQLHKRPPLSVRDEWDLQRVTTNTTTKEFLRSVIEANDDISDQDKARSKKQIRNRVITINKRCFVAKTQNTQGDLSDPSFRIGKVKSEQNLEDNLFFQEGSEFADGDYHVLVDSERNLKLMSLKPEADDGYDVDYIEHVIDACVPGELQQDFHRNQDDSAPMSQLLEATKSVGFAYEEEISHCSKGDADDVDDSCIEAVITVDPQSVQKPVDVNSQDISGKSRGEDRVSSTVMQCSLCCAEKKQFPFSTSSLVAYVKHQAQVHSVCINCPTCWNTYGIEEKFESQRALQKHYNLAHSPTKAKPSDYDSPPLKVDHTVEVSASENKTEVKSPRRTPNPKKRRSASGEHNKSWGKKACRLSS